MLNFIEQKIKGIVDYYYLLKSVAISQWDVDTKSYNNTHQLNRQ